MLWPFAKTPGRLNGPCACPGTVLARDCPAAVVAAPAVVFSAAYLARLAVFVAEPLALAGAAEPDILSLPAYAWLIPLPQPASSALAETACAGGLLRAGARTAGFPFATPASLPPAFSGRRRWHHAFVFSGNAHVPRLAPAGVTAPFPLPASCFFRQQYACWKGLAFAGQ